METIETAGIFSQEECFLSFCQFIGFAHKVVRHTVSNGRYGTRIIRPPHQFLKADQLSSLTDSSYRPLKRIKLVIEQLGNPSRFNTYMRMTSQLDLFLPLRTGYHTEMSDGHLQFRALLNYLLQFAHLCISVSHINGK